MELRDEMREMEKNVTRDIMTVFENTYGDYIKLIAELVPDKARSYDLIEEEQSRQQEDIDMLKAIAKEHEMRITGLEKATV